jgi:hypothetical protein
VGCLRLARELQPALGEMCFDRTCVFWAGPTLDKLAGLEQVDDPRDPAEAEARLVGESRQAKMPGVSSRQPTEQLEAAQTETVTRFQLGIERARELLVGLEQADPSLRVPVRKQLGI